MYKFIVSLMLTCLSSYNCLALEMSTSKIEVIKEQFDKLQPGDLFISDVMGVLYYQGDQLLSPNHKSEFKKFLDEVEKEEGKKKKLFYASIAKGSFEATPVDPKLIEEINKMMGRGVKGLILTSGKTGEYGVIPSLEDLRIKRLKSIGIDMSKMFDVPSFVLKNLPKLEGDKEPKYDRGVIFTNKNNKGESLKIFLREIKFVPKRILFVDNQMKRVESVRRAADSLGIEYIGIHYTKVYEHGDGPLNEEVAKKQIEYLRNKSIWLTDKQAKCMIEQSNNFQFCKGM